MFANKTSLFCTIQRFNLIFAHTIPVKIMTLQKSQFPILARPCWYTILTTLTTLTGLEHCSKLWCQGSFAFLRCLLSSFPRYFLVIWIQILEINLRAGLRLGWEIQWPGSNSRYFLFPTVWAKPFFSVWQKHWEDFFLISWVSLTKDSNVQHK